MSLLLVDEIREHTSGAGILISSSSVGVAAKLYSDGGFRVIKDTVFGHDYFVPDLLNTSPVAESISQDVESIVSIISDEFSPGLRYNYALSLFPILSPVYGGVGIYSYTLTATGLAINNLMGIYSSVYSGDSTTVATNITNLYLDLSGLSTGGSVPVIQQIFIARIDSSFAAAEKNYAIQIEGFSGATVNNYGIFIGNVTGTGAFAIKTGQGVVDFGDKLFAATNLTIANIDVTTPIPEVFAIGPVTATVTDPVGGSFQIKMSYDGYGELNLQGWTGTSGLLALSQIGGLLAGGTVASPSYPLDNSWLFSIVAGGWDSVSSRYLQGSRLLFATLGDWSSTNRGAAMELWTTKQNTAGNPTLAIRAKADLFALFPNGDLTVDGDTLNSVGIFKIGPIVHTFGAESFQSLFSYDNYGEVEVFAYGSSGLPNPGYNGNIAGGTFASPLYPLTNSIVMGLYANGWDEAQGSFFTSGSLQFLTTENWSATQRGTSLTLALAPAGSISLVHVFEATGSLFSVVVPLKTKASATSAAGIRLPHGTAPSSPVDGDVWTTTVGMFVQINGVTKTVTLT